MSKASLTSQKVRDPIQFYICDNAFLPLLTWALKEHRRDPLMSLLRIFTYSRFNIDGGTIAHQLQLLVAYCKIGTILGAQIVVYMNRINFIQCSTQSNHEKYWFHQLTRTSYPGQEHKTTFTQKRRIYSSINVIT